MKVLVVSDEVRPEIYHEGLAERLPDVELVLSCGDLPFYYLEYIVSVLNVPLVYVFGNHDHVLLTEWGQEIRAPRGCINAGGRVVEVKGLLIGGLEGSFRYRPHAPRQYTEREMRWQIARMEPKLLLNRLTRGRYLDILLAHAPPWGIHDAGDLPHRGFKGFLRFMERYRPRYLIHGHTHPATADTAPVRYRETEVIHVHGYKVLDIEVGRPGEGEGLQSVSAPGV
jgi:hypothetical protein